MPLLQTVILDWAGTTVDHGSLAPVRTIQSVFGDDGITVSEADARIDMGLAKKDHIRNLLRRLDLPHTEAEVERYYARFIPRQMEILEACSTVIPGVPEAVEAMRELGLKIGSTTGYTREMLDLLASKAAAQGYAPDCALVPGDVCAGRPHPFMIYETALRLKSYPLWAFVKVGDTPSDIAEGHNAGTWTVGVARTGNMVGLSLGDWEKHTGQQALLQEARRQLHAAGAHFVIDSVADLPPVLDLIEEGLRGDERPQ